MKTNELFSLVLSIVSQQTDLNKEDILHSNLEECADARCMLVCALARFLTDRQIAMLIGRTRQGVNFIKSTFHARLTRWNVSSSWKEISKQLASNHFFSN